MNITVDSTRDGLARPIVEVLANRAETEWEAFVTRHPQGTLFHTLRWRDAMRATFHHPDHYLVARRDAGICGVLPLVQVSSIFFGTTLISVPFGVYGGILADDGAAVDALIEQATKLSRHLGAKYIELRHLHSPGPTLPKTDLYCTFIADVPPTSAECLARIPKKARAEVRKAIERNEVRAEFDTLTIPELYHLFSINKRKLGSPIFPSSLFWHLKNRFGSDVNMLAIRRGDELLAGVMSFIHRGTIMPYYSGSAPGAEAHSASNYMYFKLMEWASEQGLAKFDFGRSRVGTGAFSFKKNQGFEPTQLSYDYVLNTAAETPALNPSNPKFGLAKRAFGHMPLWLAQKIGSWIAKRAPF